MTKLTALALILGLGFANQIQAHYGQDQSSSTSSYRSGTISDADLTSQIQDSVTSKNGYENVNVRVTNGQVTLQGSVNSSSDKQKIEKDIRTIDGVKGITNQITVQNPTSYNDSYSRQRTYSYNDSQTANDTTATSQSSPNDFPQDRGTTESDKQLNQKIRDKVSRGWVTNSFKDVALNTNNGYVTLDGVVESPSELKKLVEKIQKIDGVRGVQSNLSVKNR